MSGPVVHFNSAEERASECLKYIAGCTLESRFAKSLLLSSLSRSSHWCIEDLGTGLHVFRFFECQLISVIAIAYF